MTEFSEDLRMIQETAREFTHAEVLPVANELDPQKGTIPDSLIKQMAELGFTGILVTFYYLPTPDQARGRPGDRSARSRPDSAHPLARRSAASDHPSWR